jgi:threonine synthase
MLATTEKKEQSIGTVTAAPAKDKELEAMREAYRVAQELEKQEEEEMIRKAIEESERM